MNHSSGSMNMGGMDMDMGGGGSCKISMLWNWYTIDACFLAEGWHIRNRGMFAATCIGVALMTVCLEALRRGCREYDLLIARQWRAHASLVQQSNIQQNIRSGSTKSIDNQDEIQTSTTPLQATQPGGSTTQYLTFKPYLENSSSITFRATPIQQLIRAILHAATFGLAYILMLLVMYFNGYIIISIILGAGVGKFVCDWMTSTITIDVGCQGNDEVNLVGQRIRNHEDPAVCC